MAAAFAEAGIDGRLVSIQQIIRHKRLDGAGEAATLQTPGTAAVQHFLAQGQCDGHTLLLVVLDAVSILVELKAGMAALNDQLQEAVKRMPLTPTVTENKLMYQVLAHPENTAMMQLVHFLLWANSKRQR